MQKKTIIKYITLTIFSIAMGYMESAIVFYLRKLYYPGGFRFPLAPIDEVTGLIEFGREAATIIMLIAVGMLAGKNRLQKFAWFIFCFAIWDIFYYVFLKLFLGWPESLFTWDLLFLIPVPWVGPVLAPCIVSLTMITLTGIIIHMDDNGYNVVIGFREWFLLITGSLVIIFSFLLDYFQFISDVVGRNPGWTLNGNEPLFNAIAAYVPVYYNWWIFLTGELIIFSAVPLFIKKSHLKTQ